MPPVRPVRPPNHRALGRPTDPGRHPHRGLRGQLAGPGCPWSGRTSADRQTDRHETWSRTSTRTLAHQLMSALSKQATARLRHRRRQSSSHSTTLLGRQRYSVDAPPVAYMVRAEACSRGECSRHWSIKVLEQRGKLVIQFESHLGDLGCVEAAEPGAGLVEGEPRGMVCVFHYGGPQRCI
jgi:hypothetical protein